MSFLSTRLHLIWSTARREPTINPEWKPRLHGYMRGIMENHKVNPIVIGGIEDHVHVYCDLPATLTIAQLVSTIKSNSTTFMRENLTRSFGWQDGYAAFTMSKSADEDVIKYILSQEEHHKRVPFKEELIKFLGTFEIPYDPQYVFL
jgi:putative transposase